MAPDRPGFVNVDELMAQVSLEQVAAFYGVQLPEIHRVGEEVRARCFLNCGKKGETGERALAIQAEHRAKIWRCHEAGCGRGGNLVSLCDYLKPGEQGGGRPRGERFKAIVRDLLAMRAGETPENAPGLQQEPPAKPEKESAKGNLPLSQSVNERARGLVNLDEKFVVDPAEMNPKAASYFRNRPFLTPEVAKAWRMGYLPKDVGGDHAGGTMRGRIVYPIQSEAGEVLTWFGRDPEYDAKYEEWTAKGKQGDEPEKFHFVKGFQRGLELFGQHRLREEGTKEKAGGVGLVVVPGPNDVIALDSIGVPAVGLCSVAITRQQAAKAAAFAREVGNGVVTVMFDCSEAGDLAARAAVAQLATECPVRLAWAESMHGGAFKGRRPESLHAEEWGRIREWLTR